MFVCVCGHTTRPVVGLFGGVIFHLGFDMSQYVLEEIVLFSCVVMLCLCDLVGFDMLQYGCCCCCLCCLYVVVICVWCLCMSFYLLCFVCGFFVCMWLSFVCGLFCLYVVVICMLFVLCVCGCHCMWLSFVFVFCLYVVCFVCMWLSFVCGLFVFVLIVHVVCVFVLQFFLFFF